MSHLTPSISVIMPIYNGQLYLSQAIESVLAQSFENFELLLINDGSTDNTASIINRYKMLDSRIKSFTRTNSGVPSVPKNDGIDQACGEYLSFLDQDDYIAQDRLQMMHEGLNCHPEWIAVFHDIQEVHADGTPFASRRVKTLGFTNNEGETSSRPRDLGWRKCENRYYDCGDRFYAFMALHHHLIHTQSVMIARQRINFPSLKYDTRFKMCDDIDLWFRLATAGRIGYLDLVLSYHRRHDTNLSNKELELREDGLQVHCINYDRIKILLTDSERAAYRIKIAAYWDDLGYRYAQEYRLRDARTAYLLALRWNPSYKYLLALGKYALPGPLLRSIRRKWNSR